MCRMASFFHNPATGEIKIYKLDSHSETEQALKLDLKIWREGHYLPTGEVECRIVVPEDRVTMNECNERLLSRFPTF